MNVQTTGAAVAAASGVTSVDEPARALILEYLSERQPQDGAEMEIVPLSGDASTRRYYRLADTARRWVLALYPEPFDPEALSFLTVRTLLGGYGLPVPAVVDVDGPRGIVLQEDLGDCTLQEALGGCGEGRAVDLYQEAVDEIALLQQRAAAGPERAECFRIAFDIEKLSWELHYFQKHFLEGHRGCDLSVEDRATLSQSFHLLSEEIASWPRVLCHRDYHSRNLMLFAGELFWIDFQDARMGPSTYDLASLLRDAYVDVAEELQEELKERFRQKALPGETRDVFRRRFDMMCVQRNLKALGTFGFMASVRGNPVYLPYI
ncbi:MAG TPA: phosphotransferase, partial [Vicinamibacteria bacterium]|nr:phosphotransferase [Vicinamibacteria bacterium]